MDRGRTEGRKDCEINKREKWVDKRRTKTIYR